MEVWASPMGPPDRSLVGTYKDSLWQRESLDDMAREVLNVPENGKGELRSLEITISAGPRWVRLVVGRRGCEASVQAEDLYSAREITHGIERLLRDAGVRRWRLHLPTGVRLLDQRRPSRRTVALRARIEFAAWVAAIIAAVAAVVALLLTLA
jgi:hypothetical protein